MKVCLIRVHKSLDQQCVKVRKLSHLFFTQRKASMSTFEANIVARKPFFLCLIQLYLFQIKSTFNKTPLKINKTLNLQEIGIGAIKRALGNSTTPIVTISVNENLWTVSVKSTFKNDEWKFTLGQKFTQKTIDGREFYCVVTLSEDGKIVETQVSYFYPNLIYFLINVTGKH